MAFLTPIAVDRTYRRATHMWSTYIKKQMLTFNKFGLSVGKQQLTLNRKAVFAQSGPQARDGLRHHRVFRLGRQHERDQCLVLERRACGRGVGALDGLRAHRVHGCGAVLPQFLCVSL